MAEAEIRLPSDLPLVGPRIRVIKHTIGGVDVLSDVVLLTNLAGDIIDWQIIDNKPRVSTMPYTYDIAEGNVPDHEPVRRFGHNDNIGAAWETLWHGSSVYTYLTAAERLQVTSTDPDDDGAPVGDGARTLFIRGLDTNYEVIDETLTLNGVANVLTANSYLRVLKARVETAGDTGTNEGTITINDNADVVLLMNIPIGEGESHAALFTVPANETTYLTGWDGSEITNKGIHFAIFSRPFGKAWTIRREVLSLSNSFNHHYDLPLKFSQKTDIEIRVMGAAVAGEATGGFEGWREA